MVAVSLKKKKKTHTEEASEVIKENDVLEMRIKNESNSWSDWKPYEKNTNWTLSDGDGVKTVYVEVRDQGHNVVSLTGTIILDTTVPEGGYKVRGTAISGPADDYINTTSAVLFMNITDAVEMRFNNEGGPWSTWETYSPSKLWNLSAVDGAKTVNAEFRNIAMVVTPLSDNITRDTTPPTVTGFEINGDNGTTNTTNALLDYGYTEINTVWVQYMNDGGSWSADEALDGSGTVSDKVWSLKNVNGTRTVSVRLKDIAEIGRASCRERV